MWLIVAGAHVSLWGLSTLMFGVTLTGFAKNIYAFFIEHVMSNMIWVVYFGSIAALSFDANNAGDSQSYLELLVYALFFGGAALYMELIHGMGAIKHLDQDYPYPNDTIMWPSLFYVFGLIEHLEYKPAEFDIEDDGAFSISDLPFVSDPTQEEDIILNDFTVSI